MKQVSIVDVLTKLPHVSEREMKLGGCNRKGSCTLLDVSPVIGKRLSIGLMYVVYVVCLIVGFSQLESLTYNREKDDVLIFEVNRIRL